MKFSVVAWIIALPALVVVSGTGPNIFKDAKPSKLDAEKYFDKEIAHHAYIEGIARIAEFEDALRDTYASLPKTAEGTLSHDAVRYVLHRLFVARNGWFIRGLEPNDEKKISTTLPADANLPVGVNNATVEWVPAYLQMLLERRESEHAEGGTSLRELAALAAAFEDMAVQEARQRLQGALTLHGVPKTELIPIDELDSAVRTYFVGFLLAGNLTAEDADEADRKKQIFAKKYVGWLQAEEWLNEIEKVHWATSQENADYASAEAVAVDIGRKFYKFNDLECTDLKKALRDAEGKKEGRIRLSSFYKQALYSHWRFTEKADYLRVLGALDESDPEAPYVITANYLMSRPNCLEASGLYAICCRDLCEDLMGSLERSIQAPTASPRRIARLVANLSSDTVSVPRELSSQLLDRLDQVAASNLGEVPLHGRLFAQWMHHAYPRECPYPHHAGSTSPQTPDEWMTETGQSDSSASAEEMWGHVERDVCAVGPSGGVHCKEESSELPWTNHEELLSSVGRQVSSPAEGPGVELQIHHPDINKKPETNPLRFCAFATGVSVSILLLIALLIFKGADAARKCGPSLLIFNSALFAFLMDFLDIKAFIFASCAGLLAVIAQLWLKSAEKSRRIEPRAAKCLV